MPPVASLARRVNLPKRVPATAGALIGGEPDPPSSTSTMGTSYNAGPTDRERSAGARVGGWLAQLGHDLSGDRPRAVDLARRQRDGPDHRMSAAAEPLAD